jgi:hypothetical protein
VAHDATLTGEGTVASPLSVAAPTETPFQQDLSVDTPNGGAIGITSFMVPANKRLLIEFVSARCFGFSPVLQPDRLQITTSVGGQFAIYQLGPVRTVLAGGINTHIASQQVVLRADPGTTVTLLIAFPQTAAGFTTSFAISGRLFDAP